MIDPVCVDTNLVSYFLNQNPSNPEEAVFHGQAVDLFTKIKKSKIPVYLPVPALFELMIVGRDEPERMEIFKMLREMFLFSPLDVEAAILAAGRFSGKMDAARKKSENEKFPRDTIKVDWQVIACALAKKCKVLYTTDKRLLQYASSELSIRFPPDVGVQLNLPNL